MLTGNVYSIGGIDYYNLEKANYTFLIWATKFFKENFKNRNFDLWDIKFSARYIILEIRKYDIDQKSSTIAIVFRSTNFPEEEVIQEFPYTDCHIFDIDFEKDMGWNMWLVEKSILDVWIMKNLPGQYSKYDSEWLNEKYYYPNAKSLYDNFSEVSSRSKNTNFEHQINVFTVPQSKNYKFEVGQELFVRLYKEGIPIKCIGTLGESGDYLFNPVCDYLLEDESKYNSKIKGYKIKNKKSSDPVNFYHNHMESYAAYTNFKIEDDILYLNKDDISDLNLNSMRTYVLTPSVGSFPILSFGGFLYLEMDEKNSFYKHLSVKFYIQDGKGVKEYNYRHLFDVNDDEIKRDAWKYLENEVILEDEFEIENQMKIILQTSRGVQKAYLSDGYFTLTSIDLELGKLQFFNFI